MIVYMAITQDKYGLPLAISESCRGLERQLGLKASSIASYIDHIKKVEEKHGIHGILRWNLRTSLWRCDGGQEN